jgi:hypothetical protein
VMVGVVSGEYIVNALLIVPLASSISIMLLDICGVQRRLCSMVIPLMLSNGLDVGVLFCDMDTTRLCLILKNSTSSKLSVGQWQIEPVSGRSLKPPENNLLHRISIQ